jgi:cell wall-associated NlpC family hydrolase
VYALVGATLLAVSVPATLLPATTAHASPSAQDLQQQIDQKGRELDGVIEKYNLGNVQLGRSQAEAATVAAKIAPLDAQLKAASAVVNSVAAKAYKGSSVSGLSALLSAGSPNELVDRLNTLNRLASGQQKTIAAWHATSQQLEDQKTRLDTLVTQQNAQQAALAAQKTKIEAEVAALKKQRDQLPVSSGSQTSGGSPAGGASASAPYVPGRAGKVVAYAYAQLGKAYVFAAAGPNTFDCSGLTLMAWAQVGVHLDHSSWTQMNQQTTRISRSQLQPGDLVFFYGGEHVGVYVGNNNVIHAPQPGEVVKISSIDWMGGYTAAGRPG